MKKNLLSLVILLLLSGCKREIPELEFQEIIIELVSEKNCNPEEENCAFVSIKGPMAARTDSRAKKINQQIENHIIKLIDFREDQEFESLEKLAQTFIENYESDETEFPEYHIPWEVSVEAEITYRSTGLLTIQFNHAQFTGGAHGYTSVSYLNFDPVTGEQLLNNDLFKEAFTAYAENLFRKKYSIPADVPINSTGFFFENDRFYLPQNSGIVEDKLILRYNAYEVASYSEGAVTLEVPLEKAKQYLKVF